MDTIYTILIILLVIFLSVLTWYMASKKDGESFGDWIVYKFKRCSNRPDCPDDRKCKKNKCVMKNEMNNKKVCELILDKIQDSDDDVFVDKLEDDGVNDKIKKFLKRFKIDLDDKAPDTTEEELLEIVKEVLKKQSAGIIGYCDKQNDYTELCKTSGEELKDTFGFTDKIVDYIRKETDGDCF